MTGRVDQLLAGYARGDAISQDARSIRDRLRASGVKSDLFVPADRIAPDVQGDCLPLEQYAAGAGNMVIYHASIGSPIDAVYHRTPARRIMRYHNITPASFYEPYDAGTAGILAQARDQLKTLADAARFVWCDSIYNADELRMLGCRNVGVLPLFYRPADLRTEPDPRMLDRLGGGLTNILFVGRLVPNKCVEDLVLAYAWYSRHFNPASRLLIAGSDRSCPRYDAMLKLLAGRLNLTNVCFLGFVSPTQLSACYRSAGLFVCASRHEGYCLPLVEAMAHGVPVLARRCGGMPEAMGTGGALYDEADPRDLAVLWSRLLGDDGLRRDLVASQVQRVAELDQRDLDADVRQLIKD
ncbi:MAG: hypothetical protein A2498_07140 [Lentisphaerae bacterium RIFOXYC12_FULL_60_16]|nr:MAG: hypothetical protein A2498_07140 [Lentisphaerae bacterium RIFOXYC12_FULL_60_16]OGV83752.1 MAG: hypothetical protein A2340_11615 [Lentisphaerae bacterium RIFOXYB12_FULL_60_10]